MKNTNKLFIALAIISLSIAACSEDSSTLSKLEKTMEGLEELGEQTKIVDDLLDGVNTYKEDVINLSSLTPAEKPAIKEWMPKDLGDLERTEYKIGSEMGMFKVNDIQLKFSAKDDSNREKKISLKIIDGAGKGATFLSAFKFDLTQDVDSESKSGYERFEEFDGQRVKVQYLNAEHGNRSTLKYLIEDRVYVESTGWGIAPDELWEYLEEMDIEDLME